MSKHKKGKQIFIIKASGDKEVFSKEKVERSLQKAGADQETIARILTEVEKGLYSGITTKEIYKKAFSLLKKVSTHLAAKYKLKKAIQELGPSGYPFEKYIGEILRQEGFEVQVGKIIHGHCVQHEVDVIAEKGNRHIMIECKFHSDSGRHCSVKTPLYIHSRFLDIEKQWKKMPGHTIKKHEGWVATNTRFTTDALQYGTCAGLYMMSWNYPKGGSLKERVDASGLHPVTCLTTLTGREKKALLDKMIVLCKELTKNEKILLEIGLSKTRVKKVMTEAKALCEI